MKKERPMAQNTFHVALYVKDLDAADRALPEGPRPGAGQGAARLRQVRDRRPARDPLAQHRRRAGQVSHLGIRYPGTGDVASEMARAKREEVDLLEQKGTTCCYAKADKFWVRDADGMPWEMYTLLEDAEAETAADATLRRFLDQETDEREPAAVAEPLGAPPGLVHRVHQRAHVIRRRLGQDAVPEVEDVPRPPARRGEDARGRGAGSPRAARTARRDRGSPAPRRRGRRARHAAPGRRASRGR